jgi:hypothetical protein
MQACYARAWRRRVRAVWRRPALRHASAIQVTMFGCLAVSIPSRRQHDAVRLDCLYIGCAPYFPLTVWPMIVSGPSSAVGGSK